MGLMSSKPVSPVASPPSLALEQPQPTYMEPMLTPMSNAFSMGGSDDSSVDFTDYNSPVPSLSPNANDELSSMLTLPDGAEVDLSGFASAATTSQSPMPVACSNQPPLLPLLDLVNIDYELDMLTKASAELMAAETGSMFASSSPAYTFTASDQELGQLPMPTTTNIAQGASMTNLSVNDVVPPQHMPLQSDCSTPVGINDAWDTLTKILALLGPTYSTHINFRSMVTMLKNRDEHLLVLYQSVAEKAQTPEDLKAILHKKLLTVLIWPNTTTQQ